MRSFDSEMLKGKRLSSSESHVELGKELPSHKVGAEIILCYHLFQVLVDRLLKRNSVVTRFALLLWCKKLLEYNFWVSNMKILI